MFYVILLYLLTLLMALSDDTIGGPMTMSVTMSEDWNQSQTPKHFRTLYLLQGTPRCCRHFTRISSCSLSVRVFTAFRRIYFFLFRDNTSSIAIH
jgi:hypothetical protein